MSESSEVGCIMAQVQLRSGMHWVNRRIGLL